MTRTAAPKASSDATRSDAPRKPKRLTQRAIAKSLGLSPATVSMALRDDPLVAEETRLKVKAAASESGYLYNAAAGALRNGRTRLLGLAVVSPGADAELLDALEARLAAAGWTVAIAFHRDDEGALARFATVLAGREAEALIVLPGSLSDSALTEALAPLEQSGAERIRIGGEPSATAPSEGALVTVPSTPEPGHEVRAAVERLLADGRRRIALIGGALDDPQADIRGEAYRAALDAAGVPWDQWLWFRGPSGPERAMTLPTPVDALIAWDGPTAAAVRELAALYGRRLEVDLGFVALDAFASAPDPGHLADEAVAALHDRRPGAGPAAQSTAPNAAAAATSPAPAAQPSVSAEPESPAPTPVRIDPVAAPDLDPEQMDPVPLSTLGLLRRTG